jgi:hypothetical protein
LEDTAELKADGVQRFQELIGQLRWAVEIGRVDILLETSLLSSYLTMPRVGHLEQALHMYGYLKSHQKRKLAFDAAHPAIDENRFQKCDWEEFYRDASEAIPGNMPLPRGNCMSTHLPTMLVTRVVSWCEVTMQKLGLLVTSRSFWLPP